jgi:hypothetical protein
MPLIALNRSGDRRRNGVFPNAHHPFPFFA